MAPPLFSRCCSQLAVSQYCHTPPIRFFPNSRLSSHPPATPCCCWVGDQPAGATMSLEQPQPSARLVCRGKPIAARAGASGPGMLATGAAGGSPGQLVHVSYHCRVIDGRVIMLRWHPAGYIDARVPVAFVRLTLGQANEKSQWLSPSTVWMSTQVACRLCGFRQGARNVLCCCAARLYIMLPLAAAGGPAGMRPIDSREAIRRCV
jgi:hypothetical protein